jgi:hypothetical protein
MSAWPVIGTSMHGGALMGKIGAHGMRAYAKHNNACMRDSVFLTVAHVCATV